MILDPLKVWFDEAKLYLFIALIVGLIVAFVGYGHHEYRSGIAVGNVRVATLKAQYAQASQDAAAAARAMQHVYDTQALAAAQAQAEAAEKQVATLTATKTAAEQSAAKYEAALKEERKHDATVGAWLDARPPAGVRNPGQG